ncbi:MAG: hypothetical protein ACRDZ7_13535 [Acidimicrobiia bacterium]
MKAELAEVGDKIDQLAERQRQALVEQLDTMTEAELEALAVERSITGVDQATQTRDEMVAVIRAALTG